MSEQTRQVDQPVLLRGRGMDRSGEWIGVVKKVTPTQVVVRIGTSEERYNRRSGRLAGGNAWEARTIQPATPDDVARVKASAERAKKIRAIRAVSWNALPDDVIDAVYSLIASPE